MKCFTRTTWIVLSGRERSTNIDTMYFLLVLTPRILRAQTKHTSKFPNSFAIAINIKHVVIKMDDDISNALYQSKVPSFIFLFFIVLVLYQGNFDTKASRPGKYLSNHYLGASLIFYDDLG